MVAIVRKLIALIVGIPIVIIGIILVPLPGPGLLIMFAGLFILSLEFEWAKKHVETIKVKLADMFTAAKAKADATAERYERETSDNKK